MNRTTRDNLVAFTDALLLVPPVGLDAADTPQPTKPNIVFVLTVVT